MRFIAFCDIDYTLVDFPHEEAMKALTVFLNSPASSIPKIFRYKIAGFVDRAFHALMSSSQGKPTNDTDDTELLILEASKNVLSASKIEADIRWSRELWIDIACRQNGEREQAEMAVEAAQVYWDAIHQHSQLYTDARDLLKYLQFSTWNVVLVTSSDARLYVAPDGKLIYNPEISSSKKKQRMPAELTELYDTNFSEILTGDPIGKPKPQFWIKALQGVISDPMEQYIAIMIGDSYASDMLNTKQYKIHGILLDRDGNMRNSNKDKPEAAKVVRDLYEAREFLSEILANI